jgi:hypothetical protein
MIEVITVHCFFLTRGCKHTEHALTAMEAHDQMQRHYDAEHDIEIRRIVAGMQA